MHQRIRHLLPLHYSAAFALLAAVLLGACATPIPETTRTKNLLTSAGFYTRKPETPEQREIYSQMPAYTLEGGLIHGKQLYTYKYPSEGAVYVGGETEFQQYELLLAQWKNAAGQILSKKNSVERLTFNGSLGDKSYWLQEYLSR